jgi:hypothetical protein
VLRWLSGGLGHTDAGLDRGAGLGELPKTTLSGSKGGVS